MPGAGVWSRRRAGRLVFGRDPRILWGQPQAQKLLRNQADKRGHSAGGAKSPERLFALRRRSGLEAPWTARVGELAACCASRSPCFPGLAGWEAGHIHPWTGFRKEAAAFFLWIFWNFENPVAQEEEKEEGADLGRNVRVFQGLEGPEEAGNHSCQGSGTVISE